LAIPTEHAILLTAEGLRVKKLTLVARILLGLIFVGSGIAFFFSTPPPMEGPISDFFKGLMATQYFIYLLKGSEILAGLMLISGLFVPLALVILAPITLNIFLVHAFMMPSGLVLAGVIGLLQIYLAFFSPEYSPVIKRLFRAR
jgi:putative oxidoreductase